MSVDEKTLNPYGQIFVGPAPSMADLLLIQKSGTAALEVEVAFYSEKNSHGLHDALVKIKGQAAHFAGIDDKTLHYHVVPAGTGCDFRYFANGEERTRITVREPWGGWSLMQIHLGGEAIPLRAHPNGPANARPLHMLTAYQQAQGEAPSRLNLERQAASLSDELGKSKVTLAWEGQEQVMSTRRALGLVLSGLKGALAQLQADPMGAEALAEIKEYTLVAFEKGGLKVSKEGKTLRFQVGQVLGESHGSNGTDWIVKEIESAL